MARKPDSDGANARPRDDTIAQTGPGLPDDSSTPVEVTQEEAERIRKAVGARKPPRRTSDEPK